MIFVEKSRILGQICKKDLLDITVPGLLGYEQVPGKDPVRIGIDNEYGMTAAIKENRVGRLFANAVDSEKALPGVIDIVGKKFFKTALIQAGNH